jgi:hypothetical protein
LAIAGLATACLRSGTITPARTLGTRASRGPVGAGITAKAGLAETVAWTFLVGGDVARWALGTVARLV